VQLAVHLIVTIPDGSTVSGYFTNLDNLRTRVFARLPPKYTRGRNPDSLELCIDDKIRQKCLNLIPPNPPHLELAFERTVRCVRNGHKPDVVDKVWHVRSLRELAISPVNRERRVPRELVCVTDENGAPISTFADFPVDRDVVNYFVQVSCTFRYGETEFCRPFPEFMTVKNVIEALALPNGVWLCYAKCKLPMDLRLEQLSNNATFLVVPESTKFLPLKIAYKGPSHTYEFLRTALVHEVWTVVTMLVYEKEAHPREWYVLGPVDGAPFPSDVALGTLGSAANGQLALLNFDQTCQVRF
jgi:hypothetical protein